jgi:hypothetical protein
MMSQAVSYVTRLLALHIENETFKKVVDKIVTSVKKTAIAT